MAISARNQLAGTVVSVKEGAVNASVVLEIAGGEKVTSTISMDAVKDLGLAPGVAAVAVIKATEVLIGTGELKLSARNQIAGTVTGVKEGAVSSIVTVKTAGGDLILATISLDAVTELGLEEGAAVKAVIKATSVMIAV